MTRPLPDVWSTGSVKGLCARGGFEVDIEWTDGKIVEAIIKSKLGNTCKIRYGDAVIEFDTKASASYKLNNQLDRI